MNWPEESVARPSGTPSNGTTSKPPSTAP
jgi:hypothetical protein